MTEIKKYIEGINIRLDDTKQQISELEDRVVEITQAEEDKEFFKNEDSLGFPSSPVVKTPCFQCRGCRFDPWSGNSDPTHLKVQSKKKRKKEID